MSPTRITLLASSMALGLLLAAPAFAQGTGSGALTGSGSTASGSVKPPPGPTPEEIALQKDRDRRLKNFEDFRLKGSTGETAWRNAITTYRKERASVRVGCREDIRRSNKEQLLKTKTRCLRAELTLDRGYYLALQSYIQSIVGIPAWDKTAYLGPVNDTLGAVNSFVNAIDQGVFESEDQLGEAKKNLALTYETKVLDVLAQIRANTLLNWVIHLEDVVNQVGTQQRAIKTLSPDPWTDAAQCLRYAEAHLRQVFLPEELQKIATYRATVTELQTCQQEIRAIPELKPAN